MGVTTRNIEAMGFSEPMKRGDRVPVFGVTFEIGDAMTREEYVTDLEQRREADRMRGLPPARAGRFNSETGQFEPSQAIPLNIQYFYRVKSI